MLCKNNQLYVSIVLMHSFTNRMIWTNPSIIMTSLCKKQKQKNTLWGCSMKKTSVFPIHCNQMENIYMYIYINTHNRPIKNMGTASGLILNRHIHLLWFTSHNDTSLWANLTSCTATVRLHRPVILYITYSQIDEALKWLVMCFEIGKQTCRTEKSMHIQWIDIQEIDSNGLYKMLCYVKPRNLGEVGGARKLITDMSLIYILAWTGSTNNQHLDSFSYLSSYDRHLSIHTHTFDRGAQSVPKECETPQDLIRTFPPGAREDWGFLGQTSGACVSPPEPDAEPLPSPPETDLWSPRLQTPADTEWVCVRTTSTQVSVHPFPKTLFQSSFTEKAISMLCI